jgi:hypothetical protein
MRYDRKYIKISQGLAGAKNPRKAVLQLTSECSVDGAWIPSVLYSVLKNIFLLNKNTIKGVNKGNLHRK